MSKKKKIYVLGCGAIGLTLAAYLASQGRGVVAVRTSKDDISAGKVTVTVRGDAEPVLQIPVETVSLARLTMLDGIVIVTAKSYANSVIASALANKVIAGPLVIMQNGVGVEKAFLESRFTQIYRCILYLTAQLAPGNDVTFRSIASSPIGVVKGREFGLEECVSALTTRKFPFHPERNIEKDIWKKTIINSVFNSICPLLDIDNGVFVRDEEVAEFAKEIVNECLILTEARGILLTESELMDQIMSISIGSEGVLISTLQDIKNGRQTEIESLNLEMARNALSIGPAIDLRKTEFLGKMILAKSRLSRKSGPVSGSPLSPADMS
jgi:2-dehydropantoate 2-reductase